MRKQTLLAAFKTQADVARLLGVSTQAIRKWPDVVPLESALAIEIATGGAIQIRLQDYPRLQEAAEFAKAAGHRFEHRISVRPRVGP